MSGHLIAGQHYNKKMLKSGNLEKIEIKMIFLMKLIADKSQEMPNVFQFPYDIYINNIKINRTIILSVIVYGYETWSLAIRDEHTLRNFGTKC
jgi:hypothetical protein